MGTWNSVVMKECGGNAFPTCSWNRKYITLMNLFFLLGGLYT